MDRIILIGLNHKTAPIDVRECLAFTEDETRAALVRLRSHPAIDEAVLISTCNRVELLLTARHADQAVSAAKAFFSESKDIALDRFESALYVYQGEPAVRHIFRVAASLDSMVIGEPQILGQVKTAYRCATEAQSSGVILNRLLHRTFFVAKRIRSETGIGGRAVSISYAAIELGRKIFGSLEGKQVLLIGAGEMAELAVEHLIRNRANRIIVANRTLERGMELAARYQGRAIAFDEIPDQLEEADIVISSTGAQNYVVRGEQVKRIMRSRRNRPLFFIDIAVPRNIDPELNQLNNVYVYDIDDLNDVIDDNRQDREREAVKAERIVTEALIQFRQWYVGLAVVPTIKALREKISQAVLAELDRSASQLANFSEQDRHVIEKVLQSAVNKILHDPTSYLKSDGMHAGDRSRSLDTVRKLFKLDDT